MVNINLLPWREAEFLYRKKILVQMITSGIFFVLLMNIVIHVILSRQEDTVQVRINFVNSKIEELNRERKFAQMPTGGGQSFWGKLFAELGNAVETKACFTGIEEHDQSVFFKGKARSISDLTEYLRTWKAAYLFSEIRIKLIENDKNAMMRFVFEGKR